MSADSPDTEKAIAARMKLKKRLAEAVVQTRKDVEVAELRRKDADKDIRDRFGKMIGVTKK